MVRDIQAGGRPLELVREPPEAEVAPAGHYLLQLGRAYAIQCIVEGSRPAAQVNWFNRTAPLSSLPTRHLTEADFLWPPPPSAADWPALVSFSRALPQPDGTFR